MPFSENAGDFLDVDAGFAHKALWSTGGYVNGIFAREFELGIANLEGYAPSFLCAAADVEGVAHDQTLTINNVVYTIKGIQPDETGTFVALRLQAP